MIGSDSSWHRDFKSTSLVDSERRYVRTVLLHCVRLLVCQAVNMNLVYGLIDWESVLAIFKKLTRIKFGAIPNKEYQGKTIDSLVLKAHSIIRVELALSVVVLI